MARYINTFDTNLTPQEIDAVVRQYLQGETFENIVYENRENLWKKGDGFLTYPQYIKVSAADGHITVEAFLKFPLLPGVSVGEIGITGFFAYAIKAVLKGRVEQLEFRLKSATHAKYQGQMQSQQ